MSEPNSILVLGHSGYIGSRVAAALDAGGANVVGRSLPPLDLTQDESVPALVELLDPEGAVVICAAIKKQLGDNPEIFSRNMAMSLNMCRALAIKPVKRVVYFSSAAVYGEDVPHQLISESTPPEATSFYGIGKHCAERLLLKMVGSQPNSSLAIVRPALVYGPHEPAYYYGPSGFLRTAQSGQPITLWGDGAELREFIYVDDVVEIARRLVFDATTGILNAVSGTSYTFAETLATIGTLIGRRPEVTSRPRSKEKVDHRFDNAKLRNLFPDFQFTDLQSGLARTMQLEATGRV